MVEVNTYNPGGVPSLGVGTAGANYTPGQNFRALASEIGQTRDKLAAAKQAGVMGILDPLAHQAPYLGQAIGRGFMLYEQAQVKLTNQIGDGLVADNADKLADTSNGIMRGLKKNLKDNPDQAAGQLTEAFDDEAAKFAHELKTNPRFKGDPTFANKFGLKAADLRRSALKEISDWSDNQSVSNAKEYTKSASETAVDDIAGATGTIADKLQTYVGSLQRFKTLADGKAPLFGSATMDNMAHDVKLKAGVALFNNMISDVPDDPTQGISYFHSVDGLLKSTVVPLPEHSRVQLRGAVASAIRAKTGDLVDQLSVKERDYDLGIQQQVNQLKVNRFQPDQLDSAKKFALQATTDIQSQHKQIQADPTLPPEVKKAYDGFFATQLTHVRQIFSAVDSQEDHMDAEAKAQARQATSDAKAAKREHEHDLHEDARRQRDSMLDGIYGQLTQLSTLDPITNRDQIIKGSIEMSKAVKAAHNTMGPDGRPLISATKAFSLQTHANNAAGGASEWKSLNPFQQFVHTTIPTVNFPQKKMPEDQRVQANAAAKKKVVDSIATLRDIHAWDQRNKNVLQHGPQQDEFDRLSSIVRAKATKEKWQDKDLQLRLQQIQAGVLQNVPAKVSAAGGPQGPSGPSGIITWGISSDAYKPTLQGYPAQQNLAAQKYLVAAGTIDLSRRQMIDNPHDPRHPNPHEYGSEYSASAAIPAGHAHAGDIISYPLIYDGKVHPRQEALAHALSTGKHLGIYSKDIPRAALKDVETALHAREIKVKGQVLDGEVWAQMMHGVEP